MVPAPSCGRGSKPWTSSTCCSRRRRWMPFGSSRRPWRRSGKGEGNGLGYGITPAQGWAAAGTTPRWVTSNHSQTAGPAGGCGLLRDGEQCWGTQQPRCAAPPRSPRCFALPTRGSGQGRCGLPAQWAANSAACLSGARGVHGVGGALGGQRRCPPGASMLDLLVPSFPCSALG